MTEQDRNLEIVKKIENYFIEGNFLAILEWLSEDIIWAAAGSSRYPVAGWYSGKEQLAKAMNAAGLLTNKIRAEVDAYIGHGEKIIVLGCERGIASPNDLPFENTWVHLYIMENGKVREFREYFTYPNPTSRFK